MRWKACLLSYRVCCISGLFFKSDNASERAPDRFPFREKCRRSELTVTDKNNHQRENGYDQKPAVYFFH